MRGKLCSEMCGKKLDFQAQKSTRFLKKSIKTRVYMDLIRMEVSERTSRIEGMLVGPDLLREHISAGRKAKGKAGQPKQERAKEDA